MTRIETSEEIRWQRIGPFGSFADLRKAVAERRARLGVDPLAAAEWADSHMSFASRALVGALSILLLAAIVASVVGALWLDDYWLLAAIPIQGVTFYVSHPAFKFHLWVSVGIGVLLIGAIDLLLTGHTTAATLIAYALVTFAAVRASGFVMGSAFRRALIENEKLFIAAFNLRLCSVRENESKKVYEFQPDKGKTAAKGE